MIAVLLGGTVAAAAITVLYMAIVSTVLRFVGEAVGDD